MQCPKCGSDNTTRWIRNKPWWKRRGDEDHHRVSSEDNVSCDGCGASVPACYSCKCCGLEWCGYCIRNVCPC